MLGVISFPIGRWDVVVAEQRDGTWIAEATDIWGYSPQPAIGRDCEQALLVLAPLIQEDYKELRILAGF